MTSNMRARAPPDVFRRGVSTMIGKGGPIIPTQRNQWAVWVPMMPMGVIFFDQHSHRVLKGDNKAILTAANMASKVTDYLRAFSETKQEEAA
jgi:hypothetical protein